MSFYDGAQRWCQMRDMQANIWMDVNPLLLYLAMKERDFTNYKDMLLILISLSIAAVGCR
jgi:hypothetical protein